MFERRRIRAHSPCSNGHRSLPSKPPSLCGSGQAQGFTPSSLTLFINLWVGSRSQNSGLAGHDSRDKKTRSTAIIVPRCFEICKRSEAFQNRAEKYNCCTLQHIRFKLPRVRVPIGAKPAENRRNRPMNPALARQTGGYTAFGAHRLGSRITRSWPATDEGQKIGCIGRHEAVFLRLPAADPKPGDEPQSLR